MYKCKYCKATSSKSRSPFKSWRAVQQHMVRCSKRPEGILQYVFDKNEGPIPVDIFMKGYSCHKIISIYPNLQNKLSDLRKEFIRKGYILPKTPLEWTISEVIEAIQLFVNKFKRIPMLREFEGKKYPSAKTTQKLFGSWNNAIKAAGFEPNTNDGFGSRIKAKDNIIYRSWYETYFVNTYLYNKYTYINEPKYPNHNKYYDWYLPELELYIELDGNCRPNVIKEKIEINNQLGINYVIISVDKIKDKQFVERCLIKK